ncbi:MAG: hypothetical protein HZC40_08735 [Chloroflexi bacterium]|nr:hypothetical protein [Chloroflexota bacterium]
MPPTKKHKSKFLKIQHAQINSTLVVIGAIIAGLAFGMLWLSANNVDVMIGGSNLAGQTASPTRPQTLIAKTAAPIATVTRTRTATPTRTATSSPTRSPTKPPATATTPKTSTVTPTRQITITPTIAVMTTTPITLTTPIQTRIIPVSATATRAISTTTATPTATGAPSGAIAITPRELLVTPGERASYTITITNTSAYPVTLTLATSDDRAPLFASALSRANFTLPARGAATTTLTISADANASGDRVNMTSIVATVNGIERARANVATRLLNVEFTRTLNGIGVADHNVAPGTRVEMRVGVSARLPISGVALADFIPRGWTVADAGGGAINADKIEWSLGDLAAGAMVTRTYTLISPARSNPAPQFQFHSALTNAIIRAQSNPWQVSLEHPLAVAHYRVGQNTPLDKMAYLAATDAPGRALAQIESYRVRFMVVNDQPNLVRWKPRLEWSTRADGKFQAVAIGRGNAGQPFYIRALDEISNRQAIPIASFGLGATTRTKQSGMILTSENPGPLSSLNALSSTEIEFSLRTTIDAAYSTAYYFRLADEDREMPGKIAQIEMSAPPSPQLTQPQYPGIDPNANVRASPARAAAGASPHGSYSNLADQCASCHRQHTGKNRNLLAFGSAQSNGCFACHNGTGASTNIQAQYADPNVPANNATTSSFYSHPATTATNHTNATNDEFRGVLNRHSECGDCHNPHSGDASLAASTASGFTNSGALKNITGVDTNNAWKTLIAFEYELCYKCHSAYTNLLTYTKPAYKMFDKAAEFNPGNASFHPIEAAGKNNTAAMSASLAGTSPYKLWNFTVGAVVRCENCHGDYRLANPASPPAANARLASHTSRFANILMNNYRDRVLKSAGENYAAADFALCFQCHAEAPFTSGGGSSTATNFRLHSRHTTNIGGKSAATDIDTPGAGPGRAICAECHYRVHGQGANASGNPGGTRLVNFAPNVTASSGGQLRWDPATRTCYMTCHGDNHNPERY